MLVDPNYKYVKWNALYICNDMHNYNLMIIRLTLLS